MVFWALLVDKGRPSAVVGIARKRDPKLESFTNGPGMFRSIPAAQLYVVPHSGHGVMPKKTIPTFLQEGATGEK